MRILRNLRQICIALLIVMAVCTIWFHYIKGWS
jgi:hypothetical protein